MAGFGAAGPDGTRRVLCVAFAAAVASWCANDPATKGHDFNNVFFDKLREQNPQIAESITREAPMLVTKGTTNPLGMLTDLAKATGGTPATWGLAEGILQGMTLLTGMNAAAAGWAATFRIQGINELARQGGKGGYQLKFPDGMMKDGQLLEIKRPGDRFGPDQFPSYDNQSRAKSGKPLEVVSCSRCSGANCKDGSDCRRKK